MQVSRWKSFSTGYLAGTVILAVTLIIRFIFNGPFLPEIIAGNIFAIVPGELESFAVSFLGIYAKYLTAVGAAFALVMVYGLSGILYVWFDERFEIGGKISRGFLFSLLPWSLHSGFVILLDTTFPRPDIVNTLMYLFLAHLFYGATLIAFYPKPTIIDE
tara:strand:+ start:51 stop:530 length:480 start_codon:yes stop_codon:yes gene_type:complete